MAIWYVLHIVTDWTNCRCIGIPVVWSIMDWLTMLTAPVTSQVLLHLQFLWLTVLLPGSKWGDLHLSLPIWVVLCNVKDFLPKLVSLCVCEFDVQYWLDFCAGLPSISCYVLEGKLLVCLFKHTGTWAVGGNRGQSRKKKKKLEMNLSSPIILVHVWFWTLYTFLWNWPVIWVSLCERRSWQSLII